MKFKYTKPDLITESTVKEVEKQLNISFPEIYKKLVLENNGGRPEKNILDFNGEKEKVFEKLIRLDAENDFNIIEVYNALKDRLPSNIIPFASDPFGNYYCFNFNKKNGYEIVYWNHELDGIKSIEYVCDSIEELLNKLY